MDGNTYCFIQYNIICIYVLRGNTISPTPHNNLSSSLKAHLHGTN